jgi:hypothetical protein
MSKNRLLFSSNQKKGSTLAGERHRNMDKKKLLWIQYRYLIAQHQIPMPLQNNYIAELAA